MLVGIGRKVIGVTDSNSAEVNISTNPSDVSAAETANVHAAATEASAMAVATAACLGCSREQA